MRFIERPSPNHDARSRGIDMLVLHYTGMRSAEAALDRLCDPAAQVSAHYTIDRDGTIFRHVPEERRAWHAGVSFWAGEANVNARSIGIELVNPGHEFGYLSFPEAQIEAVIALSGDILQRHAIASHYVVGHSDVAPARKTDPGELFPWSRLARAGIGIWPDPIPGDYPDMATLLARFGYGIPPQADVAMQAVIAAFQRRFRPARIDGVADGECLAILAGLLRAAGLDGPTVSQAEI